MPVIAIKPHYEQLQDIPEGSYVELEDGRRVLFLALSGDKNHARFKDQEGVTGSCPADDLAKYICSIVDYEAFSCIA